MECMEVTGRYVEGIPRGNVRVPLTEFVAIWRLTEHLLSTKHGDWYVAGVAVTCRWLACAEVPSVLGRSFPSAPVSRRSGLAHEELIASELVAAETAAVRHPQGIEGRPGWLEGIVGALQWAWTGSAPPIELPSTSVG
jgi:hypothetical protein